MIFLKPRGVQGMFQRLCCQYQAKALEAVCWTCFALCMLPTFLINAILALIYNICEVLLCYTKVVCRNSGIWFRCDCAAHRTFCLLELCSICLGKVQAIVNPQPYLETNTTNMCGDCTISKLPELSSIEQNRHYKRERVSLFTLD